jgi:glycosyltransferase involved in cell wall biosynthesis
MNILSKLATHMARTLGLQPLAPLDAARRCRRSRVVVNALHAKSGGGVTYLRNLLPLLAADERLELHVFLHVDQMELFHPIDERVCVHLFDFPRGLLRLMLWEQLVLPVMVVVMSADVVFSPANFGSLLVRDQVILLRNALAVARTETRLVKRAYWAMLALITFLSLVRARRSIAVSRYAAESLSLGFGRQFAGKMRVVHHGVDPAFCPDPAIPREDFVLAVSDIYVQKNLHNLFRAMKLVCQRHPGTRLLIAGQKIDEWYYNRAVELAAELGITDNVVFLGRLGMEQLRPLYQRCKVFIFPSTAETFGMPLVEAMACGAPIASSASTAMPEIVGDAALLFDPMDVKAMGDVLTRLLDDDALRRELSARARERARMFSWHRTAQLTADVLLEAAGPRE